MELEPRQTLIVAILVLFLGKYLTRKIRFLREYNIPEPVSGGLIASIILSAIYLASDTEISFALDLRDTLLIVFFTTIGLSSKLATLGQGGKPLAILLVVAVAYLFLQNFTGLAMATLLGAVTTPAGIPGYRSPILALRAELDLYACVRPIRSLPGSEPAGHAP